MSKERVPLGIKRRPLAPDHSAPKEQEAPPKLPKQTKKNSSAPPSKTPAKKGRPSTKKGKNLVKYSMDIHPELKRAVVKAAAINDKEVHVMWNEIIFAWFEKENKKNPDWYRSINVNKSEL